MKVNTGDFDERNLAKLRAVIDAMDAAAGTDMRALTQRERKILDMWPRFEDGEPVMPGDQAMDGHGSERTINYITVTGNGNHIADDMLLDMVCRFDKRVKRPARSVLDADGVEIKVGDTVWFKGKPTEYKVTAVLDGTVYLTYKSRNGDNATATTLTRSLTHTSPKVLDADGVPIRKGDTVWHEDGSELLVIGFGDVQDGETMVLVDYVAGPTEWGDVRSHSLTHTRPDSWERLEQDAQKNACDYFGVECDSEAKCRMCPHFQDDRDCSLDMNADIVRRAKALAGVE